MTFTRQNTAAIFTQLSLPQPLIRNETTFDKLTENDILTFFANLIIAQEYAHSKSDIDSLQMCQKNYLRYLRHSFSPQLNIKWNDVDNRLLISRLQTFRTAKKFDGLEPCPLDKIIGEINSSPNDKIKLNDDDKQDLLNLIEVLEHTFAPDLNIPYRTAEIKFNAQGCGQTSTRPYVRKGP